MKMYEGAKYLSVVNGTGIEEVSDIGDVSEGSSQVLEYIPSAVRL